MEDELEGDEAKAKPFDDDDVFDTEMLDDYEL